MMLSRSSTPQIFAPQREEAPARPAITPRRRPGIGWRLLPLVVLLAGWELLARSAALPHFVLPAPAAVARRFVGVALDGTLWPHVWATLSSALVGYTLAALVGLLLGYALAQWRFVEELIAPYLAGSQAVPVVAVAPLVVLWLGYGAGSKIFIAALIVFFPVLSATLVALRTIPQPLREVAQVSGATRWQLLRYVELPLSLPVVFSGLKTSLALATTGAVVGEFVGSRRGLGVLINIARGAYDAPLIFVSLITLAGITLALYVGATLIERRLTAWREVDQGWTNIH